MNYKKDCFAFIKEDLLEGCDALTECKCEKCPFYISFMEHNYNLIKYPFDDLYAIRQKAKKE